MNRCWGINRNLHRCSRDTNGHLFCYDHRRQPIIWISFIVFTVLAGVASIYSAIQSTTKTHSETAVIAQPELVCILGEHQTSKPHFLLFSIKNEGLISAKPVSVNHYTMRYELDKNKIRFTGGDGGSTKLHNDPGHNWMFIPELKPRQIESKLTGDFALRDSLEAVDVLLFDIKFLDKQLSERKKRCVFFVEDQHIYSRDNYKTNKNFEAIDAEVTRVIAEILPDFKSLIDQKQ